VIDDEGYRRSILTQLNRGEGRHSLAREVFHGHRGELRQRYREGQEDQLGALGLVVNVLVLKHFNFLGRYSFNLAESVASGKLRPLRNPNDLNHLIE
jgi:hypothetical protein